MKDKLIYKGNFFRIIQRDNIFYYQTPFAESGFNDIRDFIQLEFLLMIKKLKGGIK